MRLWPAAIVALAFAPMAHADVTRADGLVELEGGNSFSLRNQNGVAGSINCAEENRFEPGPDFVQPDDMMFLCRAVFPRGCALNVAEESRALVDVSVQPSGVPERAVVVAATHRCFAREAAIAALSSRFQVREGEEVEIRQITIAFQRPDDLNVSWYDPPLQADVALGKRCPRSRRVTERKENIEKAKKYAAPIPAERCAPEVPMHCVDASAANETVELIFDITAQGRTENIRIVASTNDCYNEAAANAVARWRYQEAQDGWRDIRTRTEFRVE